MKNRKFIFLWSFIISFFSCHPGKENKEKKEFSKVETKISVPEFMADSAYQFVKQQVDFGPRVPGTKAHMACFEFLVHKLKSYQMDVKVQNGTVTTFDDKKFHTGLAKWLHWH